MVALFKTLGASLLAKLDIAMQLSITLPISLLNFSSLTLNVAGGDLTASWTHIKSEHLGFNVILLSILLCSTLP